MLLAVQNSAQENVKELYDREAFVDFLGGVLNLNPAERWTPCQVRTLRTRERRGGERCMTIILYITCAGELCNMYLQ